MKSKTIYLLILIIAILSYQNAFSSSDLKSWRGDYSFSEFYPPDIFMGYMIRIYEDSGDYYAEINIDGFQTMARLKTKVHGNGKSINLIFDSYLPDNMFELYKKGDLLLRLKRKGNGIITEWGKLIPVVNENKKSGKVYFIESR